jgi:hypothetical protein
MDLWKKGDIMLSAIMIGIILNIRGRKMVINTSLN